VSHKNKNKNLLIPAAAESSPSMQPLVFWPRAGAFGAEAILECAQLVWCALYAMKDCIYIYKENTNRLLRLRMLLTVCVLPKISTWCDSIT